MEMENNRSDYYESPLQNGVRSSHALQDFLILQSLMDCKKSKDLIYMYCVITWK